MGSRRHKISSIYSKMQNLLLKKGEANISKPIWFDIYTHFPPDKEPVYGREIDVPVKEIFYPEDVQRAKFHKAFAKHKYIIDLTKNDEPSESQQWFELYKKYIKEAYSENEALDKVIKVYKFT